MDEKIISEEQVILYGREYIEVTYENGEKILKRFNNKSKMWIELSFNKNNDVENIKKIKEVVKNILLKAILT